MPLTQSSDSSPSESETKRLRTDHSTRDVVMLLDDPDVSRAVEQCREVCRRKETFLVDVNDWDSEFRDKLRACGSDGMTVACSSNGTTRELMSNESCLLDLLAAARNGNGSLQRKTIGCQDGGERLHRQDGSLGRCPTFRNCGERMPCHSHQMGHKGSDDVPQLRAWWVAHEFLGRCGDKREYFLRDT